MKRIIGTFTAAALILAGLFTFSSCSKKETAPQRDTSNDYPIELRAVTETQEAPAPYTIDFTGQICILFGDGFNDTEYISQVQDFLQDTYGQGERGDLFYTVIFPDDLKNRIMNLKDKLNEREIAGLVMLGAPSGTHNMLYFLTNYWEQAIPYPVFSFCPTDDILGQETYSNMVIDCQQNSESSDTEEYYSHVKEVSYSYLRGTINYILTMGDPLRKETDLFEHAKYIFSDQHISRYVDPANNIPSMCHFVIGYARASQEPDLGSTVLINEEDEEGPSLEELEG